MVTELPPLEFDARLIEGLAALRVGPIERVPTGELAVGETPRVAEDSRHSRELARAGVRWPPIYAHRPSMAVVDGIHRLQAARRRGDVFIDVRFIEGPLDDAFIVAVRANSSQGKLLTLAEREQSARRILGSHPQWSDRAIAETCGLSARTVAALRRRSTEQNQHLNGSRVGKDGRVRPLDTTDSRRRAADLLRGPVVLPVREIARRVGLSPATVLDVRNRLARGEEPAGPVRRLPADPPGEPRPDRGLPGVVDDAVLAMDGGPLFVDWLANRTVPDEEWVGFVDRVPTGRIYVISDHARRCAAQWMAFADALESRVNGRRRSS